MGVKYELLRVVELDKAKEFDDYDRDYQHGNLVYQYSCTDDDEGGQSIGPNMHSVTVDQYGSLRLTQFKYSEDGILNDSEHTAVISAKVDKFRAKLSVYAKYGIETPKRSMLLYGPAGTGKSTIISNVCRRYSGQPDSDTAVLVWPSARINPGAIKGLIRRLKYKPEVKHLILVIEDLGGVEVRQTEIASDPDLLALLDNIEQVFKKPTFIMSTTNFPEVFLGNLTNRPQRFDEKLEVGLPSAKNRVELAKFFLKDEATKEFLDELYKESYKEFTPAHIKETVIRAAIEDMTLMDSLRSVKGDIDVFNKSFSKAKKVGL